MNYQINRTAVILLQILDNNEANSSISGITITDLMNALDEYGNSRNRMTLYRHLKNMCECGYIAKGIPDNHADTFYLCQKGKDLLKGE